MLQGDFAFSGSDMTLFRKIKKKQNKNKNIRTEVTIRQWFSTGDTIGNFYIPKGYLTMPEDALGGDQGCGQDVVPSF